MRDRARTRFFVAGLVCAGSVHAQGGASDAPLSVVRRLYDAGKHHDIQVMAGLYADTMVILPGDDTIAHRFSKAQVREVVLKFMTDNPSARVEATMSAVGPFVTVRERLFNFPGGKTHNGLDVYYVQKGKIAGIWAVPAEP